MRSYSLLLIKTCHRRGVHAMGGMAAQIPIKNNPQANEAALVKVPPQSSITCEACDCDGGLYLPFKLRETQPNMTACVWRTRVLVTIAVEVAHCSALGTRFWGYRG